MIVRAFSANKSKIPQNYNNIIKLCPNIIRFVFAENVERDIHENHWHHDFFEHIYFSLQTSAIYIYQWKGNFILISLCRRTMPWKFPFFKIWNVERLLLTSFFLTCCVLAKAKTIMHSQKEILNILNVMIGVTKYIKIEWVNANVISSITS